MQSVFCVRSHFILLQRAFQIEKNKIFTFSKQYNKHLTIQQASSKLTLIS